MMGSSLFIIISNKMKAQSDVFVLIYYQFRGQMQPIRNLLCYLQLHFVEIYTQRLEEQRKQLQPCIFQKLKGLRIDRQKLPLLVHGGLLIYQAFPIMNYLCRVSRRQDLLGFNIFQKAKVLEILQIYYYRQPFSMAQLFNLSDAGVNSTEEQASSNNRLSSFESLMNSSGYIRQICQYIQQRKNPKYVFNNITVVDFSFLQTCVYMLGVYNKLDQMADFQDKKQQSQYQNRRYLSTMREYKNRMKNQAFYIINQDYLQSFSIISLMTSEQRAKGLRKIWLGNPNYVK